GKVEGTGPYTLPVTVTGFGTPPAQVRSGLPAGQAPTGDVTILDKTNNNAKLGSAVLGQPTYGVAETTTTLPAGKGPSSATAGDFNADGIEDIAVASGDQTISVYLGTSDGKFQLPPISWATNGNPYPIEAGDFDNNGTLDLAVGNGSNLTVFKNPGTGHFNGQVDTPASDFQSLVPGDFDNDGNLDVAVVHDKNLQVYLGNGQNGFSPASGGTTAPGNAPGTYYRSAAGDFNKDGNLDLVVPDGQRNGNVWVLLGDGQGNFQPNPANFPVQSKDRYAASTAVADFDGDGNLDFAAGVFDKYPYQSSSILVYQGGTNGKTFTQKATVPTISGNWGDGDWVNVSVAVGDFNADGIPDLANAGSDQVYLTETAQVGTWLGNGSWNFTPSTQFAPGAYPLSTIVGDFNGDGFTDVSVVNVAGNNAAVGFLQPTAAVTATVNNVPAPVGNPASGKHDVFASYAGDKQFKASDSSANPTPIAPQQLGTGLTLTANPPGTALTGEEVELTAVLTIDGDPQGHVPSGEVQFKVVNEQLGPAPLTAVGDGTYQARLITGTGGVPALPTGSITITATYPGDDNFKTSTANLDYKVTGTEPVVALEFQPGKIIQVGQKVTLVATVSGPSAAVANGTV
ncbi:FG-GAP-like repeat-containing protein, partial [Phyllobacterium leguminum]|uniref:FG-GAP-like repeat-containing protein n=1 Tax=Phyllobacterium leguminum TaxID=314237 RepID=UPI0015E8B40F